MAKSKNERRRIETTKEESRLQDLAVLTDGLVQNIKQSEPISITAETADIGVVSETPTIIVPSALYKKEKIEVKQEESIEKSTYPTAEEMRKKTLTEEITDDIISRSFSNMESCAKLGLTNYRIVFDKEVIDASQRAINPDNDWSPISHYMKFQAKILNLPRFTKLFTDLGYNCMATTSDGILNINISWEG